MSERTSPTERNIQRKQDCNPGKGYTTMKVKPLTFDEGSGTWSWPPRQPNGKRVQTGRVDDMELILAFLAEHGPMENKSGTVGTEVYKRSGYDKTGGAFNNMLGDLDDLGLIDRVVKGKRTMRLALTVPIDELPESIKARLESPPRTNGQAVLTEPEPEPAPEQEPEPEPEQPEQKTALETAWSIIGEPDQEPPPQPEQLSVVVAPSIVEGVDMHQLAAALLDEVVRRATEEDLTAAPVAAERNHLAGKVKSLQKQLDAANNDIQEKANRIKGLRATIMSRDDQIKGLEANLKTAVDAAREWYQRGGQTEETRKGLERLMKTIPGFSREG